MKIPDTGDGKAGRQEEDEKKPGSASQKAIETLLEAQMLLGEVKTKKQEQERKEKPAEPVWLTAWYTLWGVMVFLVLGYLAYRAIVWVVTNIFS